MKGIDEVKQCELLDYLNKRGVWNEDYREFIQNDLNMHHIFKLCSVDGFDYMVSHFLNQSDVKGYGLIATNEMLKLNQSSQLAIGLIEGDDVICMNLSDGTINIWMIQTGNGERIEVAKTFRTFVGECSLN